MPLRPRALPAGFIAPCLPTSAPQPPSGEPWLHEIKHDGFRVIAREVTEQNRKHREPVIDATIRAEPAKAKAGDIAAAPSAGP
jgi:ATP-dependent DNA ligase